MKGKEIIIGLVGNPNCGKTTIFNALTGARQKVANWSGVTVEKREGTLKRGGRRIRVIDLPGTYSLTSYTLEEIITRDFILNERPDVIVNVVDAGNLERNLYLTTQIVEMGAKTVMALNMHDEALARGLLIDTDRMGTLLGMPVVKTVGIRSEGIGELLDEVLLAADNISDKTRHIHINYGKDAEEEILRIQSEIRRDGALAGKYSTRWLAVRLLEEDADVRQKLETHSAREAVLGEAAAGRSSLEKRFDDDITTVLADMRYGFISGAVKECVRKTGLKRIDLSERIDKILTNRFLGFPLLFLFLGALFQLTFLLGEYPKRLIELGVKGLGGLIGATLPAGPLKTMLIDGVIGGVGGVIVFLPAILILFMGISFMEDTGYMARAAFIMDKIMHRMGLHGKSFIPLVMGFGCNVPAIMASRSLENRQDRVLTIMINPFMSCSARLPVYILFSGIFFREHAGPVILSLYLAGILLAFASARLFKRFFFRGESTPFVMELPPYRMPTLRATLLHMWDRASQYLRKMGGIILAFSLVIWFLGEYPKSPAVEKKYEARLAMIGQAGRPDARRAGEAPSALEEWEREFALAKEGLLAEKRAEEKRYTMIGRLGDIIHPLLRPLGFNWQMGISLSTGFVAKEIVVSTMGVLYHTSRGAPLEEELKQAEHGITPLVAYTFMLFVLLYVPCLATIVVIGREAGWSWAAFSIAYQLSAAWVISFLFYRAGLLIGW